MILTTRKFPFIRIFAPAFRPNYTVEFLELARNVFFDGHYCYCRLLPNIQSGQQIKPYVVTAEGSEINDQIKIPLGVVIAKKMKTTTPEV